VRLPACLGQLKPFFIPMVHSPSGAVGHLAAPELPSQEGRAPRRGTRGSTGAPLSGRQSPEPWDTWQHRSSPRRRQGPELRDMWQRRSSPQQGSEVRGRGTCGGAGAHLCREVRSGAEGHVAVPELTSARRRGPGPRDTWRRRSPPLQGGVIRSYNLRGSAWMHALLLVLT
jgi:hypothetical protein